MDWLTQNWLWLLLGAGVILFFARGGMHGMGGCGGGGARRHNRSVPSGAAEKEDRRTIGNGGDAVERFKAAAIDPVSGKAVFASDAPAAVRQGRVYYFESRQNRELFEASPEQYVGKERDVGVPIAAEMPHREHAQRRGC